VSITIVCLDCRALAPEIGDGGVIGWPSMDERPVESSDNNWDTFGYPFGYIRKTFLDMGICQDQMERFADFLRQHERHKLATGGDGQFDDPDEQAIADEAREAEFNTEFDGDELIPTNLDSRARNGFIVGHYAVRCSCGATLVAEEPTALRPLPPVTWTADLLERLRDLFEFELSFYRVGDPLLNPNRRTPPSALKQVEWFVAGHLEHGVTGQVIDESAVDSFAPPTRGAELRAEAFGFLRSWFGKNRKS
jgi:hypothetical protein